MRLILSKFLRSGNPVLSELNVYDRIILLAIADRLGKKKIFCWPSYRDIRKFSGIASQSTINKSLLKLEKLQLLKIKRSLKRVNRYSFNVDNFVVKKKI